MHACLKQFFLQIVKIFFSENQKVGRFMDESKQSHIISFPSPCKLFTFYYPYHIEVVSNQSNSCFVQGSHHDTTTTASCIPGVEPIFSGQNRIEPDQRGQNLAAYRNLVLSWFSSLCRASLASVCSSSSRWILRLPALALEHSSSLSSSWRFRVLRRVLLFSTQ